jgi:prevent-host-death family protein
MSDLRIAEDIVPLGQFKTKASQFLKTINDTDRSIVITQNGKPSAVVLSPSEFDRLQYLSRFISAVQEGLADAEAGRIVEDEMLDQVLSRKQTR